MRRVLEGVRIVEVAQYVFVPVASGVLAEWGADVIKIEPPGGGDAYRGLRRTGNLPADGEVRHAFEHANRGKRSLGLDLARREGREVLGRLLAMSDVLLTNLLPASRERLGLGIEAVRRDNPRLIYARGTSLGERGPERDRGGFDHATYWARSGAQYGATPSDAERPSPMPGGAFGDSGAGLALAGGIAAALFHRERTGEGTTVDLSLLGAGLWSMAASISGSLLAGEAAAPLPRVPAFNPLAGTYRTRDGRFIVLGLLHGFYQWPMLCESLDRREWISDPRFASAAAFETHSAVVTSLLDTRFAEADLTTWRERLASLDGVWEAVQDTLEAAVDPQARANGQIERIHAMSGGEFSRIGSPVQFDEQANTAGAAPEAGQHTEEILGELGESWEEIARLKELGVID